MFKELFVGNITFLNTGKKIGIVLTMLSVITLTGCSSKGEKSVEPAKLVEFEQTISVKKRWSTRVGMGLGNRFVGISPAVTERYVYAGDANGRLVALDRESGKQLWKMKTGDSISSGINASYNMVAYGTENGEIVVRNAEDGVELWRSEVRSEILAVPQLSTKIVLVQTIDGHLYGLDRETGKRRWVYDTNVPVLTLRGTSSPVIVKQIALAGFANGKLIAINLADGIPVWEKQAALPTGRSELERIVDLDGDFWVKDSIVYAATYQGKLVAIDIPTGRLIWQRDLSSSAGVVEKYGSLYIPDSDGFIRALNADNGSEIWQQTSLEARKLSAVAVIDEYLVVGDYRGYLHWLSRKDGSFVGRVRIDEKGIRAKPIVKGNTVYVQGSSGALVALELVAKNIVPKQLHISGKRRYLK